MSDLTCWHCESAEPEQDVRLVAVIRPRSAARGGPVTVFRCRACGVDNLVERNPAGEVQLVPPIVSRMDSPTMKGPVLVAARHWVAMHVEERREFLARTASRGSRRLPDPAAEEAGGAIDAEPETTGGPTDPPPAAIPDVEVAGIIDAYEVLGLPLTATRSELSRQYRNLARKCHPDRVADLDDDIRSMADRKFRRLTRAYEIIMAQFE